MFGNLGRHGNQLYARVLYGGNDPDRPALLWLALGDRDT